MNGECNHKHVRTEEGIEEESGRFTTYCEDCGEILDYS